MSIKTPLSLSDIHMKLKEMYNASPSTASEDLRAYLIDYFTLNRDEIDTTPNRALSTTQAVDTLMQSAGALIGVWDMQNKGVGI